MDALFIPNPATAEFVSGVYKTPSHMSANPRRITLGLDGSASLAMWRDLGGSWGFDHSGSYVIEADAVRTTWPHSDRPKSILGGDGVLCVRALELFWNGEDGPLVPCLILMPRNEAPKLDGAVQGRHPLLARLRDTIDAMGWFYRPLAAGVEATDGED